MIAQCHHLPPPEREQIGKILTAQPTAADCQFRCTCTSSRYLAVASFRSTLFTKLGFHLSIFDEFFHCPRARGALNKSGKLWKMTVTASESIGNNHDRLLCLCVSAQLQLLSRISSDMNDYWTTTMTLAHLLLPTGTCLSLAKRGAARFLGVRRNFISLTRSTKDTTSVSESCLFEATTPVHKQPHLYPLHINI